MRVSSVMALVVMAGIPVLAQPVSPIRGDYVEVRSNHVFTCGCLQSGELVTGGKEAILAWQIRTGEYSGLPLAGVKAVAVVVGSGNLSVEGTPRRAILYLDGLTSESQEKAMVALLGQAYAKALGEVVSVKRVPIRMENNGDAATVVVSEVARVRVRKPRLPEDAHLGSELWYGPFISLQRSELATTLHDEFWGDDFERRWRTFEPGIRSHRGEFVLP